MPKVIIFAGANGSGKSTFANETLETGIKYINADEIKIKYKFPSIKAGQRALYLIDKNISKKKDFAFETTMSGIGLRKRLEQLKKAKYHIIIFYLFVYPEELLLERINERQKRGGHSVPKDDVLRRYGRSLINFWKEYRIFADEWSIINNNEIKSKTIAVGNLNDYQVLDKFEMDIFKGVMRNGKIKR